MIDLLLLSRDLGPVRPDVLAGIQRQPDVGLRLYRITGTPLPNDRSRLETIVRARNLGKATGSAPWVMLLDDDVVLGPGCIGRLVERLQPRHQFGAMAADCAGQMSNGWSHWDYPPHVGMASVLFRRSVLADVTFRWEPDRCECQCCCDDLRNRNVAIGYCPGALAWHRPDSRQPWPFNPVNAAAAPPPPTPAAIDDGRRLPGRIVTAFDHRDVRNFRYQFLGSLRAAGNGETVTAVGYGLRPSDERALRNTPGVELWPRGANSEHPSLRRLRDFQEVMERWPAETPVAHWDAGDVVFQDAVHPLWELVRLNRDRILMAREPLGHPESPAISYWTETIADPDARTRAERILATHPFLNGGFVAGTAAGLRGALVAVDQLRRSAALAGTRDPGDQTAYNLYCHTHSSRWHEVSDAWNFCIFGRSRAQFRIDSEHRFHRVAGGPIHVVHGTARSLPYRYRFAEPRQAGPASPGG